ncbi:MAG: Gfo/Idh/MocA family oxidoreductase [Lachnospiraceae bacterium]|nr:Gfo/Idh/MocA family oxidoreductase [Lachnospiraceae bacterium]
MAGAGRATELHMHAYVRVSHVTVRFKTIFARRQDQLEKAAELYGFEKITYDYQEMLDDEEIDVIDICTPPYLHEEMIIRALKAGKHVICEKPLTGYFGDPESDELVGNKVSRSVMYESLMQTLERIREAVRSTDRKFMYAENFVYAPAVVKAAEIVKARKSKILFIRGEESLKGSSSAVAGYWNKNGGGTLIRTGTHPLSAALWLKMQEAEARSEDIHPVSVMAEVGVFTKQLTEEEHRHILADPVDVEDNGTAIVSFSDDSKALIIANDACLGGSMNYVELYCNDSHLNCRLTMNDAMTTYLPDEKGMEDVYLSEMLPIKTGWNYPFVSDEMLRGYYDEIQDFMEAVCFDRSSRSGFDLAYETMRVLYAAYKSSEEGRRVML